MPVAAGRLRLSPLKGIENATAENSALEPTQKLTTPGYVTVYLVVGLLTEP